MDPYFEKNGRKIDLDVINYTPFLRCAANSAEPACPATVPPSEDDAEQRRRLRQEAVEEQLRERASEPPIGAPSKALVAKDKSADPACTTKVPPPQPVESREERLRREARSNKHRLLHSPKNPYCQVCQEAKPFQVQARRRDPAKVDQTTAFGDLLLADHIVIRKQDAAGSLSEKAGLMMYDDATAFKDFVAASDRTTDETKRILADFAGAQHVKRAYTDLRQS